MSSLTDGINAKSVLIGGIAAYGAMTLLGSDKKKSTATTQGLGKPGRSRKASGTKTKKSGTTKRKTTKRK